jgi:hypothetical protein
MATVSPAPEYHVEAKRMLKTGSAGRVYDWPIHLAEETWVDTEALVEAFTRAIEIHKSKGDVDPKMLIKTIGEARAIARHGRPCFKQVGINQNRPLQKSN